MNNPVAKNDFNKGGFHKNKKKSINDSKRKQKHKGQSNDFQA
ncbi:hypothetical protein CPTAKMNP4_252 [Salmonella phage vB_SenM-AKM_NP4]|uniref:Uncharacterized protein n=1 Tax=Salmonella phage S16 TaxID=1087482 RepID=M1GU96_BPS16|nr:hypothetical protein I133_gp015 [Salmonella phage vB_SenM-S16]AGE48215.1 hypothetical protein [Salmonella phage vB_SenM-S16]WDR21917.1 hypothetical protein PJM34_0249 [Salmonella phage vB_SenM_UTK0003]WLI71874.1 hypothetical protein CPTAKMNP4_252 [Salmonella phage vB_SenM-AKM_NP4]